MEFEITTLLLLAAVGLIAGFVDAIAGGGGLLCLPALLLAGLDPVSALATNKLQGTFGTGSATIAYARKGHINWRENAPAIATTFLGAALGVAAISYAPTKFLSAALPILLITMAVYFALSPKLSNEPSTPRMAQSKFTYGLAPAIGFYDGIFGPGTGSFFMLTFVSLLGQGILKASANTKLLNFTSNIAALLVFAFSGKIVIVIGLAMGVAQFIGAQLGSTLAMKKGANLIRPLLVIVCITMAVKLLLAPDNPIILFIRSI
jgi:uncharacterized protein